jgi:hypothetical protein
MYRVARTGPLRMCPGMKVLRNPRVGPLYVHVHVRIPDGLYYTNTVQATKVVHEARIVHMTEYHTNPE